MTTQRSATLLVAAALTAALLPTTFAIANVAIVTDEIRVSLNYSNALLDTSKIQLYRTPDSCRNGEVWALLMCADEQVFTIPIVTAKKTPTVSHLKVCDSKDWAVAIDGTCSKADPAGVEVVVLRVIEEVPAVSQPQIRDWVTMMFYIGADLLTVDTATLDLTITGTLVAADVSSTGPAGEVCRFKREGLVRWSAERPSMVLSYTCDVPGIYMVSVLLSGTSAPQFATIPGREVSFRGRIIAMAAPLPRIVSADQAFDLQLEVKEDDAQVTLRIDPSDADCTASPAQLAWDRAGGPRDSRITCTAPGVHTICFRKEASTYFVDGEAMPDPYGDLNCQTVQVSAPNLQISEDVPTSVVSGEKFKVALKLLEADTGLVRVHAQLSPSENCYLYRVSGVESSWLWSGNEDTEEQALQFHCDSPGLHQLCFVKEARPVGSPYVNELPCRRFRVVHEAPPYLLLVPSMILPFVCFGLMLGFGCCFMQSRPPPTGTPLSIIHSTPVNASPSCLSGSRRDHADAYSQPFLPKDETLGCASATQKSTGSFSELYTTDQHMPLPATAAEAPPEPRPPPHGKGVMLDDAVQNTPTSMSLRSCPSSFARGSPSAQSSVPRIKKTVSILVDDDRRKGSSIYTPRAQRGGFDPNGGLQALPPQGKMWSPCSPNRRPAAGQRGDSASAVPGQYKSPTAIQPAGSAEFPDGPQGKAVLPSMDFASAMQEKRQQRRHKGQLESLTPRSPTLGLRGRPPTMPTLRTQV